MIRKLKFFGSLFTVLFAVLAGRVFYIKIVFGEQYEREALRNQYNRQNQETVINPNRGSIVDRNNQSLAISHTVYNIILDIRNLVLESSEVQKKTAANLSSYLDIPEAEITKLLEMDPATGKAVIDRSYYILAKQVPRATKNDLMDSGVKCVYAEADTLRTYVHDDLASQVIGFIRGDSKWGLELQYDAEMSGQEGRMFRYYDTRNNPVSEQMDPKDGYTLVTTLDTNIQRFAEEAALNAGLEYEAQNTAVLVLNPMTCEVLAMAQYPTFNLNDPSNTDYFTNTGVPVDPDRIPVELTPEEELNNLYKVWGNYCISNTFEPGSTFKAVVVAAALEEGIISKNSTFYCGGFQEVYDKRIPCWIEAYGSTHGQQTLSQVLANSCNMGMLEIGKLLGRDAFYRYQRDFGFGEPTGIDLPGEADTGSLIYSKSGLNPVEIATGSIGQGFNNTAIQAVTAFSAVINGGDLMRPYVVAQVIDQNGNVIKENKPTVVRKVLSKETSRFMREALQEVVTPDGTGKSAVIEGYAIGGKTGTAQQGEKLEGQESEYVLSFIAYLPVENPEILAMALIDRPKEYFEGSTSAAPMLKNVLEKIITYKAIPPSDGTSMGSAVLSEKAIIIENYIGSDFKTLSKKLNSNGMDFECIGNGDIVTNQSPKAGSVGDGDTQMLFYMGESGGGAELVLVPDIRNASVETARTILQNAGFEVYVVIEGSPETGTEEGAETGEALESEEPVISSSVTVYAQMPSGDIRIERGSEIKLKAR